MSRIDEATENPNDKMPEGNPLPPDVIVPDDDAGLEEGDDVEPSDDQSVAERFGIDQRHLYDADAEKEHMSRAAVRASG